jgi:ribokinase
LGWNGPVPVPIVVVGSANADLYLELARLPVAGDTVLADGARWLPGGKGANQAAAAARLGATATLIAAVGDDAAAAVALGGLADDGVSIDKVRQVVGVPTGVATVCVDVHGDNQVVVAAGANARLEPVHIDVPAGTAAVLVSLEIPADTAAAALARAHAVGALAVLNVAPADAASPSIVAAADVVIANEGEAAAVAGSRNLAALAADAGAIVVATAGPAGVRAATPAGEELHVAALPADVVDTVGAGDCFAAALTVALAEGQELARALRFAVAAATLKVTRPGARATPTRAEVEALLDAHEVRG